MRVYIIGNDGITLCREAPTAVNDGEIAIASNEELHAAALSGKRLLALWNALPDVEKRKKVGDRNALIDQLWSAIELLPDPEPQSHSKRHLVARISWAERLGLGSVEDHSPFGDRDFAGRWSLGCSPSSLYGRQIWLSSPRWEGATRIHNPPEISAVPFKANADRRHHIPKQQDRVTNWSEYDAALRQRGSLTVWFTEEAIAAWRAEPRTTRGGQPHYSALA